jgi:hypothetical protein
MPTINAGFLAVNVMRDFWLDVWKIGMNVEMEWKDDSELQLMAGDRPQVNPIKAGIKPQDKSLYQFFFSFFINDPMVFK